MSTSKVYSISQLLGNKTKPTDERFGLWLLFENLNNLITDIGNINYTKNEPLLVKKNYNSLTPITEPFCDNIMVVKICDKGDCQEQLEKRRFVMIKKEMCGAFNSYLRGKFAKFISARHGVKAQLPFFLNENDDDARAKGILRIIGKDGMKTIARKYENPVAVPYKVELADVKMDILLKELPGILQQLHADDFYLMDFDITQDFAGIFNKMEMCDYLTSNHNFCIQGEYRENCNVILNNDKAVGIDCLMWMNSNSRIKIYNKFICQITSPGVNKEIGNHIIDFIKCPDTRLRETFLSPLAKEHGITRLEATLYSYKMDSAFNPLEHCLSVLETNKKYLQSAPLYSVPIASMWTKLSDNLQNSCCLVFNNILQFVYWGNKNTRKLTGIQIKLPDNQNRKKIINYVLSAYSFNYLPVNYVEVVNNDSKNDNISVTQKCYIKAGETFFSQSKALFSVIPSNINIGELGLVATNNIIPQVLRKRINISYRLTPFPIKEITPLSTVDMLCIRKRKLELEEIEIKRRKLEYLTKTIAIKKEHKALLEKEQAIVDVKSRLTKYFKQHPWKNLDVMEKYKISAFTVNRNEKYPYVGVLAENERYKGVYYLRGYAKNMFININSKLDLLKKDGYIVTTCGGLDIVHLASGEPFAEFKTNGITTFNGHSFAKIEYVKFYTEKQQGHGEEITTYTQEDVDHINNITMQEIRGKIKIAECSRLEELGEGMELVIKGIKQIVYRRKIRYILEFENLNSLYVSNYWLEKEIHDSDKDLNYKLKVKLDAIKTTPVKHKERLVFCV